MGGIAAGHSPDMPRSPRTLLAAAALACLTQAAACGSGDDVDGAARAPTPAPAVTAAGATTGSTAQSTTAVERARRAVRTAERRLPGSKAYDVEVERGRDGRVWEVKPARGTRSYALDITVDGRRVLRVRRIPRDEDARRVARALVPLRAALLAAARRADGVPFDEASIDTEDGRLVWEVKFEGSAERRVEVTIDARSGRVLAVERRADDD